MPFNIYNEGDETILEVPSDAMLPDVQELSTPEDVFKKVSETIPETTYAHNWGRTGFVEKKYVSPEFGESWGLGDIPRRIDAYLGVNKDHRTFAISSSEAAIHQEVVNRVVAKYLDDSIDLECAAGTIAYVFLRGVKQVVQFHKMVNENTEFDNDQKDALSFVLNAKTEERYGSVFEKLPEDLKNGVVSVVNRYMGYESSAPTEDEKTLIELCT